MRTSPVIEPRRSAAASASGIARGVGDRREHQGRRAGAATGELAREARLADPTGADHADQALGGEQPAGRGELPVPSVQRRADAAAADGAGPAPDGGRGGHRRTGPAAPPATSLSRAASAGDGSRPVSSASRARNSRAVRSARGAWPVAACARTSSRTAGSRNGSSATASAAGPSASPAAPAAMQRAGEPVGDVAPQLARGVRGRAQRWHLGEVGEGRPAPGRPRLAQQRGGRGGIGGARSRARSRSARHPAQVEPVVVEAQPVAALVGGQTGRRGPQVGPQPGDVAVHASRARTPAGRRARGRRPPGRR